jgi:pimeloyl-ACP methyl ester carboxylesterase
VRRSGLEQFWPKAWSDVVKSDITPLAFERSAHELPVVSGALARALVAELHVVARAHDHPGPSRAVRDALVLRLLNDWDQVVYAPSGFFASIFKRAATRALRRHRSEFTDMAALPIGDVLLYQSRGDEVRDFVRKKIAKAIPPVTLVAHSLGGVVCFDLLAMPNPPAVAGLVTAGSQPAFLYEIGALVSLKLPQPLPTKFPPWLNIYDRNDFLSYAAKGLFPVVEDLEVTSGQAFPESHGAYFANVEVWQAISDFVLK